MNFFNIKIIKNSHLIHVLLKKKIEKYCHNFQPISKKIH